MSIYKGYDIRGTVPDEIHPAFAHDLGCAFASYIKSNNPTDQPLRIVIARDNRSTSQDLSSAVIAGLISQGVECIDIGQAATPVFYFAADHLKCDGGIMITASHNPPQYNGFKLVRENAIPIGLDSGLLDLQALIETHDFSDQHTGTVTPQTIMDEYIALHQTQLGDIDTTGLTVAVDTGNGVSVLMVKPYLESLNTNVIPLYFEMDGTFPNHEPNPLKYENIKDLCDLVKSQKASCGIALDADGDRVIFVDEQGNPVSSDSISALLATELLTTTPGATILYDIRSSHVVKETIESCGGVADVTRVGHAYIKHTMREKDAIFAGELSGHFYFKSTHYYEAPLLVIGMVLSLMKRTGKTLSILLSPFNQYHHTGEMNFVVTDKQAAMERLRDALGQDAKNISDLDGVTIEYEDWWCNVRPSNTEDLLRLNLEAKTQSLCDEKLNEVKTIITA